MLHLLSNIENVRNNVKRLSVSDLYESQSEMSKLQMNRTVMEDDWWIIEQVLGVIAKELDNRYLEEAI